MPLVLRQPQDARLPATAGLSGEPQAGAAPDAPDGTDLGGAQALDQQAGSGAQDLPLPAPRTGNYGTQSSLVFRFHLHPATWRVRLPDGGDRLVQPLRAFLGSLDHDGGGVLRYCITKRLAPIFSS